MLNARQKKEPGKLRGVGEGSATINLSLFSFPASLPPKGSRGLFSVNAVT